MFVCFLNEGVSLLLEALDVPRLVPLSLTCANSSMEGANTSCQYSRERSTYAGHVGEWRRQCGHARATNSVVYAYNIALVYMRRRHFVTV